MVKEGVVLEVNSEVIEFYVLFLDNVDSFELRMVMEYDLAGRRAISAVD
jgi:hypothetical protein